MGMGGSAPPPPKPVSPRAEANAQIFLEKERAELARQEEELARQREAEQREIDLANFRTNVDTAFNDSLASGQQAILDRGLNAERFNPILERELASARSRIPELDANPSAFLDSDPILDSILQDAQAADRRNFSNSVNQFAGVGFENEAISNTAGDSIIQSILDEQFGDASTSIQRARERGTLTDFGFESALGQLDSQRSAAASRLNDIETGLIESGRESLRTIGENARTGANSFEIGGSFDPSVFNTRIDNTKNDFFNNLEGSFRNTLGDENLFDVNSILAKGSIAQGAQNAPAASPGLVTSLARRQEDRTKRRGLGNQGQF